jgi:hypothetical protein
MYRYIEPEVPGGFGGETELDSTVHPPIVKKLHLEFAGWLGDDIIEVFPCYLVTEALRKKIEFEKLTGVIFEDIIISKSEIFKEIYPDRQLPKFYWAKIEGEFEKDDFFIGNDCRLIISENTYEVFKQFKIENALLEPISKLSD